MDILSSDLLWSLFNVALNSYKHDSLLRPFPPEFKNENKEKDFEQLRNLANEVPQLNQISWNDEPSFKLLKWVISPKKFIIKPFSKKRINEIRDLVGTYEGEFLCDPDYIFEVNYNHQESNKFRESAEKYGILHAYHGSRTENFYSILHNGLRNNLNKVTLFGEGIYLSSDLKVSQIYSTSAVNNTKSLFGSSLSCLAVCELINHPDLKCTIGKQQQLTGKNLSYSNNLSANDQNCVNRSNFDSSSKTETNRNKRSFIKGSEGGEIPDRYFVVQNDDWVQLKYLFVFAPNAKHDLILKLTTGLTRKKNSENLIRKFIQQHKLTLIIICYVLILVLIRLFSR